MGIIARDNENRWVLDTPLEMREATTFLWNAHMAMQINCRGYCTAWFMQGEAAKYAHAPNFEAKTFIQPENPLFSHHPGRYFFVKDEKSDALFSLPHEPVRAKTDSWTFTASPRTVIWHVAHKGILCEASLRLAHEDAAELWEVTLTNNNAEPRSVSLYPYIPIGYMSWMNQGAGYYSDAGGIIATSVSPYQKAADWEKIKHFKDATCVLSETPPLAHECSSRRFEGEGGLINPDGIRDKLSHGGRALYENPCAAFRFEKGLGPGESKTLRFLIAPVKDKKEAIHLRDTYLSEAGFRKAEAGMAHFLKKNQGYLSISEPDSHFAAFANTWLTNQIRYLATLNRLTTDPQTRNFLQDGMGMTWIDPVHTKRVLLKTLESQKDDGALPDGILLDPDAQLTYINQIPHADHCVWLPLVLTAWLNETNDTSLLDLPVGKLNVYERTTLAIRYLITQRDFRHLSLMAQGDWCDPMNMAGIKGKGVSIWLSLALLYAIKQWLPIAAERGDTATIQDFGTAFVETQNAVERNAWDGEWYGRGITDDGKLFGVSCDTEGSIFLNPQSWALLSLPLAPGLLTTVLTAVRKNLETPYGPVMLSPPYTAMREDIGRVTQKFPGSAENGSVYNHASAFWVYALYSVREGAHAWRILRQLLCGPNSEDYRARGQFPSFIPNYYRGAWKEIPETAGRSSQLFNTGTVSWMYRSLIEQLFGLRGEGNALIIDPQLPASWNAAEVTRSFRGKRYTVRYARAETPRPVIVVNGAPLEANKFYPDSSTPQESRIEVTLPRPAVLIVVLGVSGSGKTTFAKYIAERTGCAFIEADDFHSEENRAWMGAGKPLTDEMRRPWMTSLCDGINLALSEGEGKQRAAVLAWSGLRYEHRNMIRDLGHNTVFFSLEGPMEEIRARIEAREGHYMGANLLESQFSARETTVTEWDIFPLDLGQSLEEKFTCMEQTLTQLEISI